MQPSKATCLATSIIAAILTVSCRSGKPYAYISWRCDCLHSKCRRQHSRFVNLLVVFLLLFCDILQLSECRDIDGETRIGVFAINDIRRGDPVTYDYKCVSLLLMTALIVCPYSLETHVGLWELHDVYVLLLKYRLPGSFNLAQISIAIVEPQTAVVSLGSRWNREKIVKRLLTPFSLSVPSLRPWRSQICVETLAWNMRL